MMSDAVHHEADRSNRVKGYRCQELREQEDREAKAGAGGAAAFVKPILQSVMQKDSLEMIVKQKIFSSQKSGDCMSKNFAARN